MSQMETKQRYVEETPEAIKARRRADEAAEEAARTAQIEASAKQTRGVNEAYFKKQRQLEEQIKNNKPIVLKPQTNEDAIKANDLRYPRPATNKPQEGFTDPYGLIPSERKPSITLQQRPDKYASSDPRHSMSRELIEGMGMNPDPTKPAFNKK